MNDQPTMTTSPFPPLTTVFTPPLLCKNIFVEECYGGEYCDGYVYFGQDICAGRFYCASTSPSVFEGLYGIETSKVEVNTYSPGLYCPGGMTTAMTDEVADMVACCPRGLTYDTAESVCRTTFTEGTFTAKTSCSLTTILPPSGLVTTTLGITGRPYILLI
ncbi:hypothetical protein GGS20DRAFT_451935 [Poronia punctata]|nr:hypothetical protein GGS20DRAFT_451935 [Poronia punctata]